MTGEYDPIEKQISDEISNIYNSGRCDVALEKAKDFIQKYPKSILARYEYAVMNGDYSGSVSLTSEQKEYHLNIAKKWIKELFDDPEFLNFPTNFQSRVRNEYYWFYELHQEQYELGIERIKSGNAAGNYSACVGASMLAYKKMLAKELNESEKWAKICLAHFADFEKYSPTWYNINYFSARAYCCLGLYKEAEHNFLDMYRKQNGEVNQAEVKEFLIEIKTIKELRSSMS